MEGVDKNRYVVIMAGGIGTRFWPMSRVPHPKQFLDVLGTGRTLLQMTFDRALKVCPKENIHIVTNARYEGLVNEQLPGLNADQIVLEPEMRNTAPCIAYAALRINAMNPDAVMNVASSDHLIMDTAEYTRVVSKAMDQAANSDKLITIGINPSRPDTGYGYLHVQEEEGSGDVELKRVVEFKEKPNFETAEQFLADGNYLWNAGIFIWSVSTILNELRSGLKEGVMDVLEADTSVYCTEREAEFIQGVYGNCENISIDFGVMEKAKTVYCIGSDFGWSDLGTWGSLYSYSEKNERGNVIQGDNLMTYDVDGSLINVPNDKLVVLHGLKDMIVVENDNILLVCKMEDEQKIKQIVADVKAQKGTDYV